MVHEPARGLEMTCSAAPVPAPRGGSQAVTFRVAPSCSQQARGGPGLGEEYLKATWTLRACLRVLEILRVLGRGGEVLPCPVLPLPFLTCLA